MCIAIAKKKNASIPLDHLVQGAKHNPDGCGLGWVENGELQIFKSMEFAEWLEKYYEVLDRCGDIEMLIHFRITSKGETRLDMCHPFRIDENHILIHNGTMSSIPKASMINGRSDTSVFAEEILAGLPVDWQYNESIIFLLEDFIGWSKVVVLDINNEFTFLNEDSGHWLNNVWYSNKSYKDYTKNAFLPATRSDNYNSNDTYYFRNRVANSSNFSTKDFCDNCHVEFEFDKLIWLNNSLICNDCFSYLIQEDAANSFSEVSKTEEEALSILEDIEKDRKITEKWYHVQDCDICGSEFFEAEMYTCWIDSIDDDLKGTKDLCKCCFTRLYQMDAVLTIEILC